MAHLDEEQPDEIGLKHALWTSAVVDSHLRSTFAEHEVPAAAVLLSGLVGEDPEGDPEVSALASCRLMLAALKVSEGDLSKLALWVEVAHKDPRDLIAAAEYRRELQNPGEESRRNDLAEYILWIAGPNTPAH